MTLQMYPHWILGALMVFAAIYSGNKDLVRVQLKTVFKWTKFLALITVIRSILMYFTWDYQKASLSDISWLPLEPLTMVWYEDMIHTLPLLVLIRYTADWKFAKYIQNSAIFIVWFSFFTGHIYQGIIPASLISLYIIYSLKASKEIGLGTLAINHVLYDLSTLALVKLMLKVM